MIPNRKLTLVAAAALAGLYVGTFWIQNIRAESYCLNARVPNAADKAWTYIGWFVSPWTLRAYCTWPGMGSLTPAMSEYAGAAATPAVDSMATMQHIERGLEKLRERERRK